MQVLARLTFQQDKAWDLVSTCKIKQDGFWTRSSKISCLLRLSKIDGQEDLERYLTKIKQDRWFARSSKMIYIQRLSKIQQDDLSFKPKQDDQSPKIKQDYLSSKIKQDLAR